MSCRMSTSSEQTEHAGLCESREVGGGLIGGSTGVRIGDCECTAKSPAADIVFHVEEPVATILSSYTEPR